MSIDQIRSYFGFTKMPFKKDLSPSELFSYSSHLEAKARISFLIEESSIGVITGEVGSGKTVALRSEINSLDLSRYNIIYIPDPLGGSRRIYSHIVTSLGEKPLMYNSSLINQTNSLLEKEVVEKGKKTVVIQDEAHLLNRLQLEDLRLLTNSNMDSSSMFSLILVGQLPLKSMLRLGINSALEQRITLKYSLAPMTLDETTKYISHHIKLSGRSDTIFSDDAIKLIHQYSRGLPRAVNNISRHSLIAAFGDKSSIIDEHSTRSAIGESDKE